MAELIPKNGARGTIADNPLADDATTLNLDTGQGAIFNAPGAGDWVRAIITDADETIYEITEILGRTSDALELGERGLEGTTPLEWPQGSKVAEVFTEDSMANLLAQASADAVLAAHVPYACVRDQKTAGTAGGTSTSGSWQTHVLNTEYLDDDAMISLSSNQFIPAAGVYRVRATANFYAPGRTQIRLRNVTAGTTAVAGNSDYAGTNQNNQAEARLIGSFSANGSDAFELQYQIQAGVADNGLGIECNFGEVEIYAVVEFWKVA